MKTLLLILLILAGLYFFPQLNEGVDSSCAATEQRFVEAALDNKNSNPSFGSMLLGSMTNGSIAREIIKSKYPELPISIGCVVTYYQLMHDPQMAKDALKL